MFQVLVGEESRDLKMFLIGFQDFLGVVHFFLGIYELSEEGYPFHDTRKRRFPFTFPLWVRTASISYSS
jgi:hypothetical protein